MLGTGERGMRADAAIREIAPMRAGIVMVVAGVIAQEFPDGRVGSHPLLANAQLGARLLESAIADAVADYKSFLEEK